MNFTHKGQKFSEHIFQYTGAKFWRSWLHINSRTFSFYCRWRSVNLFELTFWHTTTTPCVGRKKKLSGYWTGHQLQCFILFYGTDCLYLCTYIFQLGSLFPRLRSDKLSLQWRVFFFSSKLFLTRTVNWENCGPVWVKFFLISECILPQFLCLHADFFGWFSGIHPLKVQNESTMCVRSLFIVEPLRSPKLGFMFLTRNCGFISLVEPTETGKEQVICIEKQLKCSNHKKAKVLIHLHPETPYDVMRKKWH